MSLFWLVTPSESHACATYRHHTHEDRLQLSTYGVFNVLRQIPKRLGGEQGMVSGEQGTESTSLIFSSADDVSDRRVSSGGARLLDNVRTRGEPQSSSQPLSTVWADFCQRVKIQGVLKGRKAVKQEKKSTSCFHISQCMTWFDDDQENSEFYIF